MSNAEKVKIKAFRGYYEATPEPEDLGIDGNQFKIDKEIVSHKIEDMSPAEVIHTSTALIAAGAGIIAAVINGFYIYLANQNGGSIRITGKDGTSVEVPEGTSKKELDYYIAKAQELGAKEITGLHSPANRTGKKKGEI